MEALKIPPLVVILLLVGGGLAAQGCLEYKQGQCVRCDQKSELVRERCRLVIANCLEYLGGSCVKCSQGNVLANGKCPLPTDKQGNPVTLYTLAYGQYQQEYIPVPIQQIKQDRFFIKCDRFLRSGEYAHFISKGKQPWKGISVQVRGSQIFFRILYMGSSSGVMLCVIEINKVTSSIILHSFVMISQSKLIPYCLDYSDRQVCLRCQAGFHLEQGLCYADLQGCMSYFGPICLECSAEGILVQNKCIYDCATLGDLNHKFFFGNAACFC